jgi:hypothetical protein
MTLYTVGCGTEVSVSLKLLTGVSSVPGRVSTLQREGRTECLQDRNCGIVLIHLHIYPKIDVSLNKSCKILGMLQSGFFCFVLLF